MIILFRFNKKKWRSKQVLSFTREPLFRLSLNFLNFPETEDEIFLSFNAENWLEEVTVICYKTFAFW